MKRAGSLVGLAAIMAAAAIGVWWLLPRYAASVYGPPATWLTPAQVRLYSAKVVWADGLLTAPVEMPPSGMPFAIENGDSAGGVSARLERAGIVRNGGAFRDYLIYSGQDTSLQAGQFQLSGRISAIDVAREMQDATPTEVEFVVLAGWRIEEIAASLPVSGLQIPEESFIATAHAGTVGYDFIASSNTLEGFLYPGSYIVPRAASAKDLVQMLLARFNQNVRADLRQGFATQGLDVKDAVILASIVQRESVLPEEAPTIASVYLNRLRTGMRLEADPTVQYAVGFNATQGTWWTNPLSLADLRVDSPYNTYLFAGLPPAPIANPGEGALRAVAFPQSTPYFFFNARCDGSGWHVFAETFEQHLSNLCP